VPKPDAIELPGCAPIPILYEDRSVLAIDKPAGWMLVPVSWQKTARNLQAALNSSIAARDFWARSRGIKFLRYVHRLDADTSGVLLLAKSPGAVETFSDLFEGRRMAKTYLAVVVGEPKRTEWICQLKLAPDPRRIGRMKVDSREGKEAETHFRVMDTKPGISEDGLRLRGDNAATAAQARVRSPHQLTLIEARPVTGRTHQIRVHLAEAGCPVAGDELYGKTFVARSHQGDLRKPSAPSPRPSPPSVTGEREISLGLRAVRLGYADPFTRRRVEIRAPTGDFCRQFGFDLLKL
jgi:23S rRNA pseudouridine1911/1915/1917 synthase